MFNARLGFLVFLCAAASACPAPATTTTSGATASGFESRAAITIETLSPGRTWDVYVATDAPAPADATKATAVVRDGKIEINQKIRFETGSSVIRDESSAILSELVKVFTAHPDIAHVRIEGHTDTIGSAKSNQQLSEARASAVAKYLADNGVKAKLDTAGFGSTRILCSETDDECHRRNRRVEFFILGRKEETAKPAPSPKPAPVVAEASGATSLRPECRRRGLAAHTSSFAI